MKKNHMAYQQIYEKYTSPAAKSTSKLFNLKLLYPSINKHSRQIAGIAAQE